MMAFPLAPPGATHDGFEPDEAVLHKLRERLRSMTDSELIQFGKMVRRLARSDRNVEPV
jgi:hypothetical protein